MIDERFAEEVLEVRRAHAAIFPSMQRVHQFLEDLGEILFPHLSAETEYISRQEIQGELALLAGELQKILRPQEGKMPHSPEVVVKRFFGALPGIYKKLWLDAEAIHDGDPASESIDEVISAYPGFFAISTHRIAHELYEAGVPVLPRVLTEYAHFRTGIDIHPGAVIGERFCIDHGTGIVVGQTTVIGDSVKIYQGVSLGALSVAKGMAGSKRHPTIEDRVVIYSNATILGGNTIIGHDSVIGGNVWLTTSVPPYSVVQFKSEVKVRQMRTDEEEIEG